MGTWEHRTMNVLHFYESAKSLNRIKGKEDKQTLADLSSAHRCWQEKCQLAFFFSNFLLCHLTNFSSVTELSRSVGRILA